MQIKPHQAIGDLRAIRLKLTRAQITPLRFVEVAELYVGLAEVVVGIRCSRPLLQRPLEAAHGLVGLLRFAIGDTQGIKVHRVTPV